MGKIATKGVLGKVISLQKKYIDGKTDELLTKAPTACKAVVDGDFVGGLSNVELVLGYNIAETMPDPGSVHSVVINGKRYTDIYYEDMPEQAEILLTNVADFNENTFYSMSVDEWFIALQRMDDGRVLLVYGAESNMSEDTPVARVHITIYENSAETAKPKLKPELAYGSDWNETNADSPEFIANKPFGRFKGIQTLIEGKCAMGDRLGLKEALAGFEDKIGDMMYVPVDTAMTAGVEYVAKFDDEEYTAVAKEFTANDGAQDYTFTFVSDLDMDSAIRLLGQDIVNEIWPYVAVLCSRWLVGTGVIYSHNKPVLMLAAQKNDNPMSVLDLVKLLMSETMSVAQMRDKASELASALPKQRSDTDASSEADAGSAKVKTATTVLNNTTATAVTSVQSGDAEYEWPDRIVDVCVRSAKEIEYTKKLPLEMADVPFSVGEGAGSMVHGTGSAKGVCADAQGNATDAAGDYSHSEGHGTHAEGYCSHAEGNGTDAKADYSHAEGFGPTAEGYGSHAEGHNTTAKGQYSHTEGESTAAEGYGAHAEGYWSNAKGDYSHAEGAGCVPSGKFSHAEGSDTVTNNYAEHAGGFYNDSTANPKDPGTFDGSDEATLMSVGNGKDADHRHNAFEIKQDGTMMIADTHAEGEHYEKPLLNLQRELKRRQSVQPLLSKLQFCRGIMPIDAKPFYVYKSGTIKVKIPDWVDTITIDFEKYPWLRDLQITEIRDAFSDGLEYKTDMQGIVFDAPTYTDRVTNRHVSIMVESIDGSGWYLNDKNELKQYIGPMNYPKPSADGLSEYVREKLIGVIFETKHFPTEYCGCNLEWQYYSKNLTSNKISGYKALRIRRRWHRCKIDKDGETKGKRWYWRVRINTHGGYKSDWVYLMFAKKFRSVWT